MSRRGLSKIAKRLISTAAAVAVGCRPCTAITIHHAREAGASEEEIKHAITIGLEVKRKAYDEIHQEARKYVDIPPNDSFLDGFKGATTTDWLIATGAAFAANFTLGLEHYSAAAEQLGATASDLQMVLEIARRVKEQARRETDKIAAMVAPIGRRENFVSGGCGCMPDREEKAATCCS